MLTLEIKYLANNTMPTNKISAEALKSDNHQ